jgi:hypothetical protein
MRITGFSEAASAGAGKLVVTGSDCTVPGAGLSPLQPMIAISPIKRIRGFVGMRLSYTLDDFLHWSRVADPPVPRDRVAPERPARAAPRGRPSAYAAPIASGPS